MLKCDDRQLQNNSLDGVLDLNSMNSTNTSLKVVNLRANNIRNVVYVENYNLLTSQTVHFL